MPFKLKNILYGWLVASLTILFPLHSFCQDNKKNDNNKIIAPAEIYNPLGTPVEPDKTDDELAMQYYASGDYVKAAEMYKKLYAKNPNNTNYRYYFYSLIGSGEYDDALQLAKKAGKSAKKSNRLKYQVDEGYVYIINGSPNKGYKIFDDALKNLSADENEIYSLANSFTGISEYKYAIKVYQKGRELLQKPSLFCYNIAHCSYLEKDYPNMAREMVDYIVYDPKNLNRTYSTFQNYMSNDPDGTISDAIRSELLARTQKHPNITLYSEMMLWYSVQVKDFELAFRQVKALDKLEKGGGEDVLEFANTCFLNDNFKIAEQAYNYVIDPYKNDNPAIVREAKIGLSDMAFEQLKTNENITQEQLNRLDKEFSDILAETSMSVEMLPTIINAANLKAFYLHDYDAAAEMLESLLTTTKKSLEIAQIKLALGDIRIASGDPWEAILLYSQVEKALKEEPLGHEAKYRNALVSYYLGEFGWAETKLDVLKASTEKLIANDAMKLSMFIKDNKTEDSVSLALKYFSKADFAVFNKEYDKALCYLDSAANVNAWSPVEDDALYKKAEIYIEKHKYAEADSLLGIIEEKYPDEIIADEALYTRAFINERYLNNKEKAQSLYEKIVLNYSDSVFAVSAREKFRELRGDKNINVIAPEDDIIYVPMFHQQTN